jgi:hypothetical protein
LGCVQRDLYTVTLPGWRRTTSEGSFSRPMIAAAKRAAVVVALAVAVLLLASPAAAYETPTQLTEVAHFYSLGVGEVRCPSKAEWDADPYSASFGWGYTNVHSDYSVLAPHICDGALHIGASTTPLWQQAAGALVLVHEAFHLRHWRFRGDEGRVECQAIVYFTEAATKLGASDEQPNELYPYALALHLHTQLFFRYRDRQCVVPAWVPPLTLRDEGNGHVNSPDAVPMRASSTRPFSPRTGAPGSSTSASKSPRSPLNQCGKERK